MRSARVRILLACATLLAVAGLAAAFVFIGGGDDEPTPAATSGTKVTDDPLSAEEERGRALFREVGCGGCHTLAGAGTSGNAGPNLDLLRPDATRVARQVTTGARGMPSFSDRLTDTQISVVARFVAASAERTGAGPVVRDFEPDSTKLADCTDDSACFQRALGNVAFREGPQKALARFEKLMAENPVVERDCHRIVHAIGAASLAGLDGEAGVAIARGSAVCWSGYYHGVLERSFAGVPDAKLGEVARDLCAGDAVRSDTFIAYQCVHGLGHGLMIRTGYDLPGALSACDELATSWDQSSCTGGVFMENISSSYGVTSQWLRDDDLIYPCNDVAERHKLYCYLMVTSRVLEATDFDWDRAASECRRADEGWVATCFQSLGRDASGNSRQNADRIAEICGETGDMEAECIYGAARDIVSNDAGPDRAATLCRALDSSLAGRCWEGVGTILATLHGPADERRKACTALGEDGASDCMRGAGVGAPPPPESVRPAP